jgi:hypothetical protein
LDDLFSRDSSAQHPDALRFALLVLDRCQKVFQRGFLAGVAGQHLVSQRKAFPE